MTEADVIEFRPRNPNGSSGRTRAPLGAATRYGRLLEIALQGRSWDVVAAELNLQGHSAVNGGAWTAASAKNAWTTHRGLRHDVFRSEAQLLPVLEAGTAGYAWDETLEKFHQTARNVSPTGCRWSTEQLAAIFCEYATTDEKAAREHITARSGTFNAANNSAASANGANPTRMSNTYRIMRTPGLLRRDTHIESDMGVSAPCVGPLFHVSHMGADWGLAADVLTSLQLAPPEPFDIWCGLLVQRLWRNFACWTDRADRAENRENGPPVSWAEAISAVRESHQPSNGHRP